MNSWLGGPSRSARASRAGSAHRSTPVKNAGSIAPGSGGQISGVRRRSTKPRQRRARRRRSRCTSCGPGAAHGRGVGVHEALPEARHASAPRWWRRVRSPTRRERAHGARPSSGPRPRPPVHQVASRSSPAGSAPRSSSSRRSRPCRTAARSGPGSHRGRSWPSTNWSLPTGAGRGVAREPSWRRERGRPDQRREQERRASQASA